MSDNDFQLNQLDTNENDAWALAIAMQKKASENGFDWPNIAGVVEKVREELEELNQEITEDSDKDLIQSELGDLLFACCNLARHLNINPHEALTSSNQKFYRRFNYVETRVSADGKRFSEYNLDELDSFWNEAKQLENIDSEDD